MQITFPGPDGQPVTVTDPRHEPGEDVSIALPQERRPACWIVGSMKV